MSNANNLAFLSRGVVKLIGANSLTLAQNATGVLTFSTKALDTAGAFLTGQNLRLPKGKWSVRFFCGAFGGGGTATEGDGLNTGIRLNAVAVAASRVNFRGANTGIGYIAYVEDILDVVDTDNISFSISTSHANGLNLITAADWTRVICTPVAP